MKKAAAEQKSSTFSFSAIPTVAIVVLIVLALAQVISYWWSIGGVIACMVWTTLISTSRSQRKLAKWEALVQWGALIYIVLALLFGVGSN